MKKVALISIIITSLFSCSETEDLTDTVMIYEENTGLPVYSEWGYNTFGVEIDRKAFTSDYYEVPLKVTVENDTTTLIIEGYLIESYECEQMTMEIKMQDFSPDSYMDFLDFNDSTLSLKDSAYSIRVKYENEPFNKLSNLEGELTFKRTQNLYVDDRHEHIIMSGVFGFKALEKGSPVTYSDGRFDFALGDFNFYKY